MSKKNFHGSLVVAATTALQLPLARQLADELALPLLSWEESENQLVLTVTQNRLELHERTQGRSQLTYVDFSPIIATSRRQEGIKQPLARAAGIKSGLRPTILDATPGLGRDAFVLAALGCPVQLVERSAVIFALLQDGLRRAQDAGVPEVSKMTLFNDDAIDFMTQTAKKQRPDVIYLDPMHPERTKSAMVKKEMRLLREVVGNDDDGDNLLQTALTCAKQRVVVKRPRLGTPLGEAAPHAVITGRSIRYDLYFPTTRPPVVS